MIEVKKDKDSNIENYPQETGSTVGISIEDTVEIGEIRFPLTEEYAVDKTAIVQMNKRSTVDRLANLIVVFSCISFFVCLLMFPVFIYSFGEEGMKFSFELFQTVSSFISGPLGFTLGFYFRQSAREP